MKQHITRAYNKFKIDNSLGIIQKISKETRLKDEINFYKGIQDNPINIWFPRYVNSTESINNYLLSLEYYAYDNLGDLMVRDEFNEKIWTKVIDQINNSLLHFRQFERNTTDNLSAIKMYKEKTLHYYYELIGKFRKFRYIINHKALIINDVEYLNFNTIWDEVEKQIDKLLIPHMNTYIMHGDFCFSNIMYGITKTEQAVLKYVDPRGAFGEKGIYGDPLYDIAKLMHSYEGGYEYIIYDKFTLEEHNQHEFSISFENDNREKITKLFKVAGLYDLKAKLIEGLIFIGMCSRHYDSLDRQIVMYLTGIKLLNEVLEELK